MIIFLVDEEFDEFDAECCGVIHLGWVFPIEDNPDPGEADRVVGAGDSVPGAREGGEATEGMGIRVEKEAGAASREIAARGFSGEIVGAGTAASGAMGVRGDGIGELAREEGGGE